MRVSAVTVATLALLSLSPSLSTTADAFVPRQYRQHGSTTTTSFGSTRLHSSSSATAVVQEVATKPIPGMKPGTSGLRKKVEIWQGVDPNNKHYLENFIQALLDTAAIKNGGKMPKT